MRNTIILGLIFSEICLIACNFTNSHFKQSKLKTEIESNFDTATFAGGCFWCVEAIFTELKGVKNVQSGYTGGNTPNPSYEEVCSGKTGHAEAIQIVFDSQFVSFTDLLEVFWQTHDPTTLNRQGEDVGTQYRSAVFYHNEIQKIEAENFKNKLIANKIFENEIVTQIVKADVFYKAENYHQNYYSINSSKPYCALVIKPKLDKFRKQFKDKIK
ncbi:MAG: peptide-methionine (S)-S-oxide reductase MsrA [Bacteroidetes bacterium]|nr:peptide-methionine (S)-S-oxide reductase MsrA [Bacteroidota bacterium]